jgi:hypothetical protein
MRRANHATGVQARQIIKVGQLVGLYGGTIRHADDPRLDPSSPYLFDVGGHDSVKYVVDASGVGNVSTFSPPSKMRGS